MASSSLTLQQVQSCSSSNEATLLLKVTTSYSLTGAAAGEPGGVPKIYRTGWPKFLYVSFNGRLPLKGRKEESIP